MNIISKREDTAVVLEIEGRVNSNTSLILQTEILNAFQNSKNLILDFAKMPYISSAGLRALLIGQKTATSKGGSMQIINVTDMVMSILDSVGFSQILNIKK